MSGRSRFSLDLRHSCPGDAQELAHISRREADPSQVGRGTSGRGCDLGAKGLGLRSALDQATYLGADACRQANRALAEAYGLRYLLIGPASGTTTTIAALLGISAVLGEVGGQGRWPAEDVALHAAGFRRLLRAAGLIDEAPETPRHATEVLRAEAWMGATRTGYWHPSVEVGMRVAKGTVVGEVCDACGRVLERAIAPLDGVVIFLVTSLAMNEGDPLLALAS
jgi:predicted deacylase